MSYVVKAIEERAEFMADGGMGDYEYYRKEWITVDTIYNWCGFNRALSRKAVHNELVRLHKEGLATKGRKQPLKYSWRLL